MCYSGNHPPRLFLNIPTAVRAALPPVCPLPSAVRRLPSSVCAAAFCLFACPLLVSCLSLLIQKNPVKPSDGPLACEFFPDLLVPITPSPQLPRDSQVGWQIFSFFAYPAHPGRLVQHTCTAPHPVRCKCPALEGTEMIPVTAKHPAQFAGCFAPTRAP